jgi:hypothetical protein
MTDPAVLTTDSLERLARAIDGRLVLASDADWDTARQAWNLAIDQHPELVAFPADADDVAEIVKFAGRYGLRVTPQGTGHAAAAHSELTGTILLRTDSLREITVDRERGVVRVGAGVQWSEVTDAVAPLGLVVRAGSSGSVGVIGFSLGGGYSWLGRKHGLAVSSITAAELVTGDGTLHRVDAEHEPDLFWAVRGGGGNTGIITALEFTAIAVSRVYGGALLFPLERASEVLTAYEQWTRGLDESATTCVRLLHLPPLPELPDMLRGKSFVGIDGAIEAPTDQAERILAPLRALGPVLDSFAEMPAAGLGQIHMDPLDPTPARGDGLILGDLPAEAIAALLEVAGPGVDSPLLAIDLRHLGGAIGRPGPGGGAVDHIPGRFLLNAVGVTPVPEAEQAVLAHVERLQEALAPWTEKRDYMNFREVALPATRFYSEDTLTRLLGIQAAHDPNRVIRCDHELTLDPA